MSTTKRIKQLQECGCGCGTLTRWNHLRLLRAPDNTSHFVLDCCRSEFEAELLNKHKLREIFATLKGFAFWRRWPFARMVQALNYLILVRRHGEHVARAKARRQAVLFCLPNAATQQLIKIWK